MVGFSSLSKELVIRVLDFSDWESVLNMKFVNHYLKDVVSCDVHLSYVVQLGKLGMKDNGDVSGWSEQRRLQGAREYARARLSPDKNLRAFDAFGVVDSRIIAIDGRLVAALKEDGSLHVMALPSPLRGARAVRYTSREGRALTPPSLGPSEGFGFFSTEGIVLDAASDLLVVVQLTNPRSPATGIRFIPTTISTGETWDESLEPILYDSEFRVCTRDFKLHSEHMCCRGGLVMFTGVPAREGETIPIFIDASKNKRLYVLNLRTGKVFEFDRVLAATFTPRHRVVLVRALSHGPCIHKLYMQCEVHDLTRSATAESGSYTRMTTLQLPYRACKPDIGTGWFQTGNRVGLPAAQGGIIADAGAFQPDDFSIFRFPIPDRNPMSEPSGPIPGFTAPLVLFDRVADDTRDPYLKRPLDEWTHPSNGYGASIQFSDQSHTVRSLARQHKRSALVDGPMYEYFDFHEGRTRVALQDVGLEEAPSWVHNDDITRGADEAYVAPRVYLSGGRYVCRDGFLEDSGPPCCERRANPPFPWDEPPATWSGTRPDWCSNPPTFMYVCPRGKHVPPTSPFRLAADVLLEFPGCVTLESLADRGLFTLYKQVLYRPLVLSQ